MFEKFGVVDAEADKRSKQPWTGDTDFWKNAGRRKTAASDDAAKANAKETNWEVKYEEEHRAESGKAKNGYWVPLMHSNLYNWTS